MLPGKKVPDLVRGIKIDGFDLSYGNDLDILKPRHTRHQLRNTSRDSISDLGIMPRSLRGDEYSCGESRFLQGRCPFEHTVVGIEVLHENRVARGDVLSIHEAPPYPRDPEHACQKREENNEH